MTRLIANSDLYNRAEYGRVREGEEFTCRDSTAAMLVRNGSARHVAYEAKVITFEALEVSTRDPFHFLPIAPLEPVNNVPVPHAEPAAMAASSDPLLPSSKLSEPRAADRSERRGRKK